MLENEILKAKEYFDIYGKGILEDKEISILINQYKDAIGYTWKTMETLEVTESCSECAAGEPGGCCFQEVETWYTDVQILINMLMGVNIPKTRMYSNSCMFVGDKGCRLLSRNAFCINFLCDKIKTRISVEEINTLNSAAGKEIDLGIRLENAVTGWLSANREIK